MAEVVKTHQQGTGKIVARGKICLFADFSEGHAGDCYNRCTLVGQDVLLEMKGGRSTSHDGGMKVQCSTPVGRRRRKGQDEQQEVESAATNSTTSSETEVSEEHEDIVNKDDENEAQSEEYSGEEDEEELNLAPTSQSGRTMDFWLWWKKSWLLW
eukprot:jgi/Psemu1/963/gm1.963_g